MRPAGRPPCWNSAPLTFQMTLLTSPHFPKVSSQDAIKPALSTIGARLTSKSRETTPCSCIVSLETKRPANPIPWKSSANQAFAVSKSCLTSAAENESKRSATSSVRSSTNSRSVIGFEGAAMGVKSCSACASGACPAVVGSSEPLQPSSNSAVAASREGSWGSRMVGDAAELNPSGS